MIVVAITQTYKFKNMPKTVSALNHEVRAYFTILVSPVPFTGGMRTIKKLQNAKSCQSEHFLR